MQGHLLITSSITLNLFIDTMVYDGPLTMKARKPYYKMVELLLTSLLAPMVICTACSCSLADGCLGFSSLGIGAVSFLFKPTDKISQQ